MVSALVLEVFSHEMGALRLQCELHKPLPVWQDMHVDCQECGSEAVPGRQDLARRAEQHLYL